MIATGLAITDTIASVRNGWEEILKKAEPTQVTELQEKTNSIAQRMGLKATPQILLLPKTDWGALGTAQYPNFRGIITVPAELFEKTIYESLLKDSHAFIIAHELSHFQYHHRYWKNITVTIVSIGFLACSLFAGIYSTLGMMVIEAIAIIFSGIFKSILCRYQEKKADLHACQYTTDNEKIAFIAWFQLQLKNNLKYRNKEGLSFLESFKRKLKVDSLGNDRADWDHPAMTERINYIRNTLDNKIREINPHALIVKSVLFEEIKTFPQWWEAQILLDSEGNIRSDPPTKIEICKHLLRLPLYFYKYRTNPKLGLCTS